MNIKLFGEQIKNEEYLQEYEHKFTLSAKPKTYLEFPIAFEPIACLLNSDNFGYGRVILDYDSLDFLLGSFE